MQIFIPLCLYLRFFTFLSFFIPYFFVAFPFFTSSCCVIVFRVFSLCIRYCFCISYTCFVSFYAAVIAISWALCGSMAEIVCWKCIWIENFWYMQALMEYTMMLLFGFSLFDCIWFFHRRWKKSNTLSPQSSPPPHWKCCKSKSLKARTFNSVPNHWIETKN